MKGSVGNDHGVGFASGSDSGSSVSSSGSGDDHSRIVVLSSPLSGGIGDSRHSPVSQSPVRSRVPTTSSLPLHPRSRGVNLDTPAGRLDEGNSEGHRLPLPPGFPNHLLPASPTRPSTLPIPRTCGIAEASTVNLSKWKKGRLLGRGTFGTVYLGFNSENGQMCAIKEVKVVADDRTSKECLKQLNQEITLLSQFSHPNIVRYYGSELKNQIPKSSLPSSCSQVVHAKCLLERRERPKSFGELSGMEETRNSTRASRDFPSARGSSGFSGFDSPSSMDRGHPLPEPSVSPSSVGNDHGVGFASGSDSGSSVSSSGSCDDHSRIDRSQFSSFRGGIGDSRHSPVSQSPVRSRVPTTSSSPLHPRSGGVNLDTPAGRLDEGKSEGYRLPLPPGFPNHLLPASPTRPSTLPIPRTCGIAEASTVNLSKWKKGRLLGRGTFGTVYLGFNRPSTLPIPRTCGIAEASTVNLSKWKKGRLLGRGTFGTVYLGFNRYVHAFGSVGNDHGVGFASGSDSGSSVSSSGSGDDHSCIDRSQFSSFRGGIGDSRHSPVSQSPVRSRVPTTSSLPLHPRSGGLIWILQQEAEALTVNLSKWKKGMVLGRGTFGTVYLGFNSENGQMCAIKEVKVVADDLTSKECLKQLNQEITLLSQFSHPNIVWYYGSELELYKEDEDFKDVYAQCLSRPYGDYLIKDGYLFHGNQLCIPKRSVRSSVSSSGSCDDHSRIDRSQFSSFRKASGKRHISTVYLGFSSENGQICAIKEVKVVADDRTSKECLKQLNREITLLSQFSHPNIVRYYGSELGEETLSVYLEYVSGGSIHKLLQDYGSFKEAVIQNYARQILSGLAYLHARNTVHRDIKGANILVYPNSEIKLADFGMAKHLVMNTNGYSLAVDIWSLGCTVLEMATSMPPWSQYEGVAAIFKIGNSKDMPDIPDHLSTEAKSFVRLCLQRDPSARPTASQLLEHPFVKDQIPTKVAHNAAVAALFAMGGNVPGAGVCKAPPGLHAEHAATSQHKGKKTRRSKRRPGKAPVFEVVIVEDIPEGEDDESSECRVSAFKRLGGEETRVSAFDRLDHGPRGHPGDLRRQITEGRRRHAEESATSDARSARPERSGERRDERTQRRHSPTRTEKTKASDQGVSRLTREIAELKRRVETRAPYSQPILRTVTPFTPRVMSVPLPANFWPWQIKAYNGTTDPQDHLSKFYASMEAAAAPDEGTIDDWDTLAEMFLTHFAANRRQRLPYSHLLNICIRKGEKIRDFITRWEKEARDVHGADDQALVAMFQAALPRGEVRKERRKNPPPTYQETLARAKFLTLEEFDDAPDSEAAPAKRAPADSEEIAKKRKKKKDYTVCPRTPSAGVYSVGASVGTGTCALLSGFTGDSIEAEGVITVPVIVGDGAHKAKLKMEFMVVSISCAHNMILGLEDLECVISPYYLCMKFPTPSGIGVAKGDQKLARLCYVRITKKLPRDETLVMHAQEEMRKVKVEASLAGSQRKRLVDALSAYRVIFAWGPGDIPGVDPKLICHCLAVNPEARSVNVEQIRRAENAEADILSKLSSDTPEHIRQMANLEELSEPSIHASPMAMICARPRDWMDDIVAFLKDGAPPQKESRAQTIPGCSSRMEVKHSRSALLLGRKAERRPYPDVLPGWRSNTRARHSSSEGRPSADHTRMFFPDGGQTLALGAPPRGGKPSADPTRMFFPDGGQTLALGAPPQGGKLSVDHIRMFFPDGGQTLALSAPPQEGSQAQAIPGCSSWLKVKHSRSALLLGEGSRAQAIPGCSSRMKAIAKKLVQLSGQGVTTIIGGRNSVAEVEKVGLGAKMSHISTEGRASRDLLEGKILPGSVGNDHGVGFASGSDSGSSVSSSGSGDDHSRIDRSQFSSFRLLGRGTFGTVYLGFNSENGQMCAIKEVEVVADDRTSKECLKQLNQEITLLSQFSQPNIVRYYGSELGEETLSVYLEYVSGGSIHKLLQDYGSFKEAVIQNYARQILSCLAYLHARNTVHRDIKGANILVDPNGEIKLADFGMAKHVRIN
ncbi:unnamed protein product [Cuscuta campestris]|uniref:Protein kinase domain-containing protein n=1 Tax=Cuscuta campestris TaxID=132261 RepID=A0A484MTT8_9ASTE|nr:unnamed protein product [Cuscuta campestris]